MQSDRADACEIREYDERYVSTEGITQHRPQYTICCSDFEPLLELITATLTEHNFTPDVGNLR